MAFLGIGQYVANVLLGVIAAIGIGAVLAAVAFTLLCPFSPGAGRAPGCQFSQPGITVNLYAPAGTIGEVEVHTVEFEQGHSIHLLEEKLFRAEVARHVKE